MNAFRIGATVTLLGLGLALASLPADGQVPGQVSITSIKDEAKAVIAPITVMNFTGAGVTVTKTAPSNSTVNIDIPGGSGTVYYQTVADLGVSRPQEAILDFSGAAFTVTDNAGVSSLVTLTTLPADAATLVGTGRTLSGTAPITIGGGASGDLSADRTIAISAASGGAAGSMSATDKAFVDALEHVSTDEAICRFDGASGGTQDSLVSISDLGDVTLPALATIDGRDLSVDGTKLDAIEAGADNTLAGAGMTKTGSTLNVIAADGTITVNADNLQLNLAQANTWTGIPTWTNGTVYSEVALPSAPSGTAVAVVAHNVAGAASMVQRTAQGYIITPNSYGQQHAVWQPLFGNTTTFTSETSLFRSLTDVGTVTHGAFSAAGTSADVLTTRPRVRHLSATTANAGAGIWTPNLMYTRGAATNAGGFICLFTFTESVAAATGTAAFVGLNTTTAQLGATDPKSIANNIGFGYSASDAAPGNWYFFSKDATTAGTPVDTTCARTADEVYQFVIYCPSNGSTCGYAMFDLTANTACINNVNTYNDHLPANTAVIGPMTAVSIVAVTGTARDTINLQWECSAGPGLQPQ